MTRTFFPAVSWTKLGVGGTAPPFKKTRCPIVSYVVATCMPPSQNPPIATFSVKVVADLASIQGRYLKAEVLWETEAFNASRRST